MSEYRFSRDDLSIWFAFCGRVLASPDAEVRPAAEGLLSQNGLGEDLREELSLLLREVPADPLDQHREYIRLFLSPAGAPCPLWQSAHGDDPQMMGPPHHSAIEWFRAEGIEPVQANEPADHASLLLVFFSHLLDSDTPPERLHGFLKEHLEWLPGVLACIERETRLPLFARIARVTREGLEEAGEAVQEQAG